MEKLNLKNCQLLVTPTSYGKYDPSLKTKLNEQVGSVIYSETGKPLSSDEVARIIPGVDGYIAGLDVIDEKALLSADNLKVISRYGVGVDKVDLDAARKKGIVVTNTPGANSASVAELALSLMFALARNLIDADKAVRKGEWPRYAGVSLQGKTIGIIGLGAIGKELAKMLMGFGCRILATDPYVDKKIPILDHIEIVDFDQVIASSDVISLHVPLLADTENMIEKSIFSRMKKGAFLINTSRGEVVNEHDLIEALKTGQVGGAALDAFCEEPPSKDNPLFALPNVIATPHLGAQTDGATSNMGWMAMYDCLAVLKGEEPLYRVA